MNREPSKTESYLIVVLLAIILGAALALAAGCHTLHGIGTDLKSATSHYVQDPQ